MVHSVPPEYQPKWSPLHTLRKNDGGEGASHKMPSTVRKPTLLRAGLEGVSFHQFETGA